MYFEPELVVAELDLPKFSNKVSVDTIRTNNLSVSPRIYECPVCKINFERLISFIKCCSSHVPEINFVQETVQKVQAVKEMPFPAIKIENDTEMNAPEENECDEDYSESEATNDEDDDYEEPAKNKKAKTPVTKKSIRSLIPAGTDFCCPICSQTFNRRPKYLDHMDCHENPLLKCCQLCSTEFENGRNANKHKRKFHPDLYRVELEERQKQRKLKGARRRFKMHERVEINSERKLADKNFEEQSLRLLPKTKSLIINMERIFLPGFLENNWVFLPKNGEDYPWVYGKEKLQNQDTRKLVAKGEPISDVQSKLEINVETKPTVMPQPFLKPKQEPREVEVIEDLLLQNDIVKIEPDIEYYDDIVYDDAPFEIENEVSDQKPIKENEKKKRKYVQLELNNHYPQFTGDTYIFDLYSEKRKADRKERVRKRKEMQLANKVEGKKLIPLSKFRKSNKEKQPKRHWARKICPICGELRAVKSFKRHVATHCVEENDLVCRICGAEYTVTNKLKQHYIKDHEIKFREYLYKTSKERFESGMPEDQSQPKFYTCHICFWNMKTYDHLQHHIDILHNYTVKRPSGSRECELCQKTFMNVKNRNIHMFQVHDQVQDGSIFCEYCGRSFIWKGFLLMHFRKVHFDTNGQLKQQPYMTEKRYIRKSSRENVSKKKLGSKHKNSKENEMFICHICGKTYTRYATYQQHQYVHSKEASDLKCPECGVNCKNTIYFKMHMERHGEPKYFCDFEGCGKGYAVKQDVRQHKLRKHYGKPRWQPKDQRKNVESVSSISFESNH